MPAETTPTPSDNSVAEGAAPPTDPTAVAAPMDAQPTSNVAEGAPQSDPKPGETPPEEEKSLLGEDAKEPFNLDTITLPEGIVLDDAGKAEFGEFAKAHGLTQEAANAALALGAKHVKAAAEASSKLWQDTNNAWREQVIADKDIGGDKLDTKVRPGIAKLINSFPEAASIRQMLDYTGTGNHPVMIKFLYGLAQKFNEGGPVAAGGPPAGPKEADPARVFYGKPTQMRQ